MMYSRCNVFILKFCFFWHRFLLEKSKNLLLFQKHMSILVDFNRNIDFHQQSIFRTKYVFFEIIFLIYEGLKLICYSDICFLWFVVTFTSICVVTYCISAFIFYIYWKINFQFETQIHVKINYNRKVLILIFLGLLILILVTLIWCYWTAAYNVRKLKKCNSFLLLF